MRQFDIFAAAAILTMSAAHAAPPAYSITKMVPLGAPEKWDFVTFDPPTHRVYVAHSTRTSVVDGRTGQVLGQLDGLSGAHGQVVVGGIVYADSGAAATLTGFDAASFKPVSTMPAGKDADAVMFEPTTKRIFVMDGDGESATVLDSAAAKPVATIALGGSPEVAVADGKGAVFANIASTGEIVKIDARSFRISERWKLDGCIEPRGLAIDTQSRRLFASCLNAQLKVVDADGGKVLQTLKIGRGTDGDAFDSVRKLVFSSNGDGTLSAFHEQDGILTALGDIPTAQGARTMALDEQTGRVYLVAADVVGKLPDGHHGLAPKFAYKPGSAKLLFLDPPKP